MYKIMIKHSTSSNSSLAGKMYEVYGSEITSKNAMGATTTFTPFETDDIEVLKAEVLKLDSIYGHENIMICQIVDVTYDVEITTDDTEETPTTPDDATGDSTDDGDDTMVTP